MNLELLFSCSYKKQIIFNDFIAKIDTLYLLCDVCEDLQPDRARRCAAPPATRSRRAAGPGRRGPSFLTEEKQFPESGRSRGRAVASEKSRHLFSKRVLA